MQPSFKTYAKQVMANAQKLGEELKRRGFDLVTGGTDSHLLLLDMTSKNISGKQAEKVMGKAGITVNKNTIPFDPRSPFDPSGIRLGTPALTTRGMKEKEMVQIAGWIDEAIRNADDEKALLHIHKDIEKFVVAFPLPK
jgi:glycine hydroxymethyltransferase